MNAPSPKKRTVKNGKKRSEIVGIAPAGHALADTAGLRTVNLEAALNLVWCDGVAVVGISGPLIGPPPHGGDSGHLHLPVYALAGAAKLRLLR